MNDGAAALAKRLMNADEFLAWAVEQVGGRRYELVAGEVVEIDDPVIVVEVVSPSSVAVDKGAKLEDYFRLPSVRHYLIVRTRKRTVIHHARAEGDRIETRIVRSGALHLDPPGLTVEVESFFES